MKKRPSFFLFVASALGAALAYWFEPKLKMLLVFLLLCIFLVFLIKTHGFRVLGFLCFLSVLCASAFTIKKNNFDELVRALPEKEAVYEGIVQDAWEINGAKQKLWLKFGLLNLNLYLLDSAARLKAKPGQKLNFRTKLVKPSYALSPVLFDSYRYGLSRNIHATGQISKASKIYLGHENKSFLGSFRYESRQYILRVLSPQQAGLLLALMFGDTSLFSPEQKESFQNIGATHLLAVSGLQVNILAVVFYFLLAFFIARFLPEHKKHQSIFISAAITIVLLWLFVALCHFPKSAIRAALMSTIFLSQSIFNRRLDGWDCLFSSAFLIVLFDPLSILDLGFWLSYGASFGIMLTLTYSQKIMSFLSKYSVLTKLIVSWALLSLGAFLGTFGILQIGLEQLSWLSWLTNWLLVPIAGLGQVPAIILGFLGVFLKSPSFIEMASLCAAFIEICAQVLNELFGTITWRQSINSFVVVLANLSFFLLLLALLRLNKMAMISGGLSLLLSGSVFFHTKSEGLRLTVIPVGQGDSTLIQSPSGHNILIDAGGAVFGDFDPGAKIVVPTLKRLQVDSLEVLIISHPDPDHVMGAFAVMNNFPIAELWHSGFHDEHPLTKKLLFLAKAKNIKVKTTNQLLKEQNFGELQVKILAPNTGSAESYFHDFLANDNSLVFWAQYDGVTILWPGDIEKKGEEHLLAQNIDLKAAILKAPHHGSKTSSSLDFVEQVAPQFVVYSTGKNNRFGFPHDEVQKRYQAMGAKEFNTAVDGELSFKIYRGQIEIARFAPICTTKLRGPCF